jgi:hypothetical protein
LIFDQEKAPFHGHMPYEGGRPLGWTYHRETSSA